MSSLQNPFSGHQSQIAKSSATAQTDQQRAIAEVQAAMVVARANPRNQIQAMDRILNACTRPTLANAAVYTYAKGGSDVSGPSIRLAEAMAQAWGNMQFGIRELDQANGESTVQAYAWDVETNTRREITFQVPHIRHTRKGTYKLDDPREIYELVANQGSRRLRACILAVIPGDVTETAVQQCEATMNASADTSQDAMQKMVTAFSAFGVDKEQVEKRIQRRIDAIQPAQVVALKKIYASLRDGMSSPSDWFEVEVEQEQKKQKSDYSVDHKKIDQLMTVDEFNSHWQAESQKIKELGDAAALANFKKAMTPRKDLIEKAHNILEKISQSNSADALEMALGLSQDLPDESLKEVIYQRYSARLDEISGVVNADQM